jgi:hypothetical protein
LFSHGTPLFATLQLQPVCGSQEAKLYKDLHTIEEREKAAITLWNKYVKKDAMEWINLKDRNLAFVKEHIDKKEVHTLH